jgi:hypothetical protein
MQQTFRETSPPHFARRHFAHDRHDRHAELKSSGRNREQLRSRTEFASSGGFQL